MIARKGRGNADLAAIPGDSLIFGLMDCRESAFPRKWNNDGLIKPLDARLVPTELEAFVGGVEAELPGAVEIRPVRADCVGGGVLGPGYLIAAE